jgi:hypothetical protein
MPEFVLPEFTRSLRALALPSAPGSGHDRVLAPLVQARAAANRMHALEAQVAAFDAARLERAWREAIASLAAERHAGSAPDRRALEATLDDLAQPVWAALERLRQAGAAARTAPGDARAVQWERWVVTVQRLFEAADDWWGAARTVLEASPAPGRPWWRRLRRRGAR